MLDIMRRKKRMKAVLWVVIISLALGMLLFFVPGQDVGPISWDTSAASIDGDTIEMNEYLKAYRRILDSYTQGGRNRLEPEVLKSLGLGRQALDALINTRVVNYAARRLGLEVAPEEIRRAVETNPSLQDQGAFIGVDRYKALLAANNLGVVEFEDGLRSLLLSRKVRHVITDAILISDSELRDEYTRRNEEAQVVFSVLKKDDFRKRVAPAEADLKAWFDARKEKYFTKEQRRAQYLLISISALAATVSVSDQEIREQWDREAQSETVDASHILFAIQEAEKEAEVKAKAEAILKRVRAGEDFAELARKNSDDPGSAPQGGNLGPFGRGRMVKEFEDAAFALQPGQVSDLVRTQFGYHIIKVLKHDTPTLESRRGMLERTVRMNKASELAKNKAEEAKRLSETQKDLQAIAKALNVPAEVKDTGLVAKGSDPFAIGLSQPLLDDIFQLKEIDAIGKESEHPLGFALPKLIEIQLPKPPEFTSARAEVEKDYVDSKAGELLLAAGKSLSAEATAAGGLEKAARKAGVPAKTSTAFKRDGIPDAELGALPAFTNTAFKLPVGGVSDAIRLDDNRVAVLQVKSRTAFDEAEFQKQKEELRNNLKTAIQDSYFQEYIKRITADLEKAGKIRINPKAIEMATEVRY